MLLVEDDERFRERLAAPEARMMCAPWRRAEARAAAEESPELAVVDLEVGAENGLDWFATRTPSIRLRAFLLTGYSIATALESAPCAANYLTKPDDADQASPLEGRRSRIHGLSWSPLARVEREHINGYWPTAMETYRRLHGYSVSIDARCKENFRFRPRDSVSFNLN